MIKRNEATMRSPEYQALEREFESRFGSGPDSYGCGFVVNENMEIVSEIHPSSSESMSPQPRGVR